MIYINNRRYIGNKHKLLPYILKDITNNIQTEQYSFADLFAGTGVVAHSVAKKDNPVIVNDILYSNVVAYKAWLSDKEYCEEKITELISYFNNLNYSEISDNYFSEIYGNKYFSCNDAKKIGYIRDYIESNKKNYTEREYFILLTILLYATDKIANTVGHFEYFLKKQPVDSFFQLSNLQLENLSNVEIFNEDANILAKKINADVVYIDPPYNARQYVNFYHVLENLARWNKPTEFEGNSMKFKRDELKSGYSRAQAPQLFSDLINDLNCKLIVVSYNNTYNARSGASINKISEEQIMDILSVKGEVLKREIDYNYFNAGKTDLKNHKEYLYVCKVR